MSSDRVPCSIIILTYNGRDIIEQCLPSVNEEIQRRGNIDELLIVDNAGSDDTAAYVTENYPNARIIRLEVNKSIFAMNDGVHAAKYKYVFLLVNDMQIKKGCIDMLMAGFADDSVFAVTGKVLQWDRSTVQAARRCGVFHRGMFWYLKWKGAADEAGPTLYALGGQSMFERDKFLELGGTDPLFSPFYHEDLDLSWRAWRRGWRVLFEPEAVMIHKGQATVSRLHSKLELDTYLQKNLFIFIWKNIHSKLLIASHIVWLIPRVVEALIRRDRVFLLGLKGALRQMPEVQRARKRSREQSVVSDAHVLKLVNPKMRAR